MEKSIDLNLKRGDIVWLYDNKNISANLGKHVQSLKRPFIIISNNKNNYYCPNVNVLSLSSQIKDYPMHVLLDSEKYGLGKNSMILCEQVFTIGKDLIREVAASLDEEDINRLNKALTLQLIG